MPQVNNEDFEKTYPLLTKVQENHEKALIIGEFLEWLATHDDYEIQNQQGDWVDIESTINEFFDVDPIELEKERQALLNSIK